MKHTEESIQKAVDWLFCNHTYRLTNAYIFAYDSESDWFGLSTPKNYAYEVEVKISKSDFKADFKKPRHKKYIDIFQSKEGFAPNIFYYAVPHGMIQPEDVPEYAGLIYVSKLESSAVIVKKAPYIHKNILNLDRILKEKFYHRYLNNKYEHKTATQENKRLKKQVEELSKTIARITKPKKHKRNHRQYPLF